MNCEAWRIEISAFLDGGSDPRTISRISRHLEACSSCLEFHREQSELNALLGAPELEATPPEYLWYRIEGKMEEPKEEAFSFQAFLARWFGFWQVPRLRYAVVSALLALVVCSWSLLQIKNQREADQILLARIDAYQLDVVPGNPFLAGLKATVPSDNPFVSLGSVSSNPFEAKGSQQ